MREIKFRGKACGEWVYGSLIVCEDGHCVINWVDRLRHISSDIGVNDKTIGQYTGLHDCKGREIFEGDILQLKSKNPYWGKVNYKHSVEWGADGWILADWGEFSDCSLYANLMHYTCTVIGNIFDNPDMIGG